MMKRAFAGLLVCVFACPSAFAGDLRDGIAKASGEQAQQNASASSKPNPYLWPGVALIGGGLVIAAVGFLSTNEVSIGGSFSTVEIHHNTALGITGIGVAALGGVVIWLGEKKAKASPEIRFVPGGVILGKTIKF